jgi:hypothetical protein
MHWGKIERTKRKLEARPMVGEPPSFKRTSRSRIRYGHGACRWKSHIDLYKVSLAHSS